MDEKIYRCEWGGSMRCIIDGKAVNMAEHLNSLGTLYNAHGEPIIEPECRQCATKKTLIQGQMADTFICMSCGK